MKTRHLAALIVAQLFLAINLSATVRYVDVNSAASTPPYTNWASAATTIQDAVDVANTGDLILVTNGVYEMGGRAVDGILTNRVAITNAVTVLSVNGPEATIIKGSQLPGSIHGAGAVRGIYLSGGAHVSGFTITNGATLSAGDSTQTEGGGVWCDSSTAVVSNCVLVGNSAYSRGGGAFGGTFYDCTIITNFIPAGYWWGTGGGVYSSALSNCTLRGNFAWYGGGAAESSVEHSLLTGNQAHDAGGAGFNSVFSHCKIIGNVSNGGGGTFGGILSNCLVASNTAAFAGGTISGTLNNCTITANSADTIGGAYCGILNNCIVYGNTAATEPNYLFDGEFVGLMNHCCTTPAPLEGEGNITSEPMFVDATAGDYRLQPASPCINAGDNLNAPPGPDLDGNARIIDGIVDMGAYENTAPQPAGVHYVDVNSPNPTPPYTNWAIAAATIQDAVDATSPGGQILVANGIYRTGGRPVEGTLTNRVAVTKPITIQSVAGPEFTIIEGFQVPSTGLGSVRCVYLADGAKLIGFTLTNGATKLEAGGFPNNTLGGGVFCESTNAVVSNCVLIGNAGQQGGGGAYLGTLIDCKITGNQANQRGGGAYSGMLIGCEITGNQAAEGAGAHSATLLNCVIAGNTNGGVWSCTVVNSLLMQNAVVLYGGAGGAANRSLLINCTLLGNSADEGGGAYLSELINCTIADNQAIDSGARRAGIGGGASSCTLHNCILSGNSADKSGGGAVFGVLNNCAVVNNSALIGGGGVSGSTVNNSIVYHNSAPEGENHRGSEMRYCCTTPPADGTGNFAFDPLFVDVLAGELRLQSNSPCINAGHDSFATTELDLDGNPRIVGGSVDIGAYEFQSPASTISYEWLQRYGLPTDGTADFEDNDQDGANNWQEWYSDTVPTNSLSALRMLSPTKSGEGLSVRWESVNTRLYFLERAINIAGPSAFSIIATNIPGQGGTNTYTDAEAIGAGPFFYRVGVSPSLWDSPADH